MMTDPKPRPDVVREPDPAVHALAVLWSRKKTLMAVAIVGGVLAVVLSFTIPKQFRATATILPRFGSGESGLLAALGNFANLPMEGELSIEDLYPAILRSDRLLDRVIVKGAPAGHPDVDLYELLKVGGAADDSLRATLRLKKALRERVLAFHRDRDTGVMSVTVMLPGSPDLAADMANLFTDELADFVEAFNRDRTRGKLDYIQQRVDDVAAELAEAEADLTEFLMENRATDGSPQLKMAASVKERHVQALTTVWVELVRQHELAKMDDNEEAFAVEVLDRAQPPLHKYRPRRAGMGLIGAILFVVLGCATVLVRDYAASGSGRKRRAG